MKQAHVIFTPHIKFDFKDRPERDTLNYFSYLPKFIFNFILIISIINIKYLFSCIISL